MIRAGAAVLSLLMLSGCAVVDLTAHGIKQYEKSKTQTATAEPEAQPSQPAPAVVAAPVESVSADAMPDQTPIIPAPVSSGSAIKAQPLN